MIFDNINVCTYCEMPLTSTCSMSMPIQGVPRIYSCNREWCKFSRMLYGREYDAKQIVLKKVKELYFKDEKE